MNKAIGIIIVGHGKYSAAILQVAESILGSLNDCVAINVESAHDTEEALHRLQDAAQRLDQGAGVLALTDMFGGTPTNLALSLLGQHKAEVVTGINLPMILKVFENRDKTDLATLARMAEDAGKAGIVVTGSMLRDKNRNKN